jgi:hypothetical protein
MMLRIDKFRCQKTVPSLAAALERAPRPAWSFMVTPKGVCGLLGEWGAECFGGEGLGENSVTVVRSGLLGGGHWEEGKEEEEREEQLKCFNFFTTRSSE